MALPESTQEFFRPRRMTSRSRPQVPTASFLATRGDWHDSWGKGSPNLHSDVSRGRGVSMSVSICPIIRRWRSKRRAGRARFRPSSRLECCRRMPGSTEWRRKRQKLPSHAAVDKDWGALGRGARSGGGGPGRVIHPFMVWSCGCWGSWAYFWYCAESGLPRDHRPADVVNCAAPHFGPAS